MSHEFEKRPTQSKKFIAYLIAEIGWKIILAAMIAVFGSNLSILAWGLMMGVIIVSGFIQTGMILGQASLDKYIRIAKINAGLGVATSLKKGIENVATDKPDRPNNRQEDGAKES